MGVAVCFQICTTLLSMDDGCGLSQTLLVLVRFNNYYYYYYTIDLWVSQNARLLDGGGGGRAPACPITLMTM